MRMLLIGPALTHAFGERYDSPVPLSLFVFGGAVVVCLSFLLIYRREVVAPAGGPPAEEIAPPRAGPVAATISLLVLALLIAAGVFGSQGIPENIVPTAFWVYLWVALPLAVGVIGDFTGPVNPFAAIARGAGASRIRRAVLGTPDPLPWPERLGYWIAVFFFFLVVLGELVVNAQATLPRVSAVGFVVYAVLCAAGALVFGADAWVTRAELFTVLFATWGKLGYFRFRAPGRRGFAGGLEVPFEPVLSRVVFVLLLLVSVTFDGLLSTPQWKRLTAALPGDVEPGTGANTAFATLSLVILTALMMTLFGMFAVAAARAGRHGESALGALTGLLPSLLPISFGYLLAHYMQYILINGQLIIPLLGDPFGTGHSVLPYPFNDDYEVNTSVMPISVVWYFQIIVIILAHIVAVVLAHRYLVIRSEQTSLARRAEWPWLVAMVGYTMISLWLLAQPLVEEPSTNHEAGPAPASVSQAR
jgi:hypothetical protein